MQVRVPHQRETVMPWHHDESDYPLWSRAQVAATLVRCRELNQVSVSPGERVEDSSPAQCGRCFTLGEFLSLVKRALEYQAGLGLGAVTY